MKCIPDVTKSTTDCLSTNNLLVKKKKKLKKIVFFFVRISPKEFNNF